MPVTRDTASSAPPISTTPPALRLPGDVVPRRYQVELTVVPREEHLTGRVRIDAEVKHATRLVWLNATELTVKSAKLGRQTARVIPGGDDFVGLGVEAPLALGPVAIELDYQASIDHQRSRGVYAEKEGAETYAYTFFEATDARRAFPCFDEPRAKVPWQLTLHVQRSDVALANTPVESEADEPNGMKRIVFATTPPLPSYLLAFVVGPFEVIDGGATGGVPIRFVVPRGRSGELGWAKQVTPKSLQALIDWFGSGYPFKKLDVAVVPRYWGTMEHPGLVAMGQPLTLIPKDQETRPRKESYLNILSHELGHYWFGDWVTTAWWDDTWLNEALGEWIDLIITDRVMPEWHVLDERVAYAAAAMDTDELLSTRAIRQPVESKEAIGAAFDNEITYFKGASVMRMFEALVGPQKWQSFLRRYLQAHQWGNATAEDLLTAMRQELGPRVAEGFRGFLNKPGVPLISAQLECQSRPTLLLRQKRSLPDGVKEPGPPASWDVPVCVRYGDGTTSARACVQLEGSADATTRLPLETSECPTWVLPNDDAHGYYRSHLDKTLARELFTPGSPVAKQAQPTVAERMMAVVDLSAAVKRAELNIVDALALGTLIAKDPADKVASGGVSLAGLRTDAMDDEWYRKAEKFELNSFGPLARRLGWKREASDSDDRQGLRRQVLAIATTAGDAALSTEGTRLADAWMKDPSTAGLSDDMVSLALRVSARNGDAARYQRFFDAAKKAPDRTSKGRLVAALGDFTDPKLVARSLDLVLGSEFDVRETVAIAHGLLSRRETRPQAWTWLQAHLDELIAKMRSDEASWLLGAVSSMFCDPEHRKRVDALLSPVAERIDGARAQVTRGLEQTDRCIADQARDREALHRFLAEVR
jgi:aminopeptidase N